MAGIETEKLIFMTDWLGYCLLIECIRECRPYTGNRNLCQENEQCWIGVSLGESTTNYIYWNEDIREESKDVNRWDKSWKVKNPRS